VLRLETARIHRAKVVGLSERREKALKDTAGFEQQECSP